MPQRVDPHDSRGRGRVTDLSRQIKLGPVIGRSGDDQLLCPVSPRDHRYLPGGAPRVNHQRGDLSRHRLARNRLGGQSASKKGEGNDGE